MKYAGHSQREPQILLGSELAHARIEVTDDEASGANRLLKPKNSWAH